MHFTVLSAGSVMIELLTVLENAELVNCVDGNPRHYSGALLLRAQYSWSYEDRIVWENRHQKLFWVEHWCERGELCVWKHSWNTLIKLFHLNFNFDICSRMIYEYDKNPDLKKSKEPLLCVTKTSIWYRVVS